MAVAGALAAALLAAGCAKSVSGQAVVNAAAQVPASAGSTTTGAAPPSIPTDSDDSSDSDGSSSSAQPTDDESSSSTEAPPTATPVPPTSPATSSDGSTTRTSSPSITSIPGLSADCNKVLAGAQAFTTLFEGITSSSDLNTKVSQATVDKALAALPASGFPAAVQGDVNTLRAWTSAASGKTITDLAMSLTDGKVTTALTNMSSWVSSNCY